MAAVSALGAWQDDTGHILKIVNSTQEIKITQADAWVSGFNRRVAKAMDSFRKGVISLDPAPLKEARASVLEMFRAADPTVRARITSQLSRDAKDNLVGHARAMAILAIRSESPALIFEGLTALGAEAGTGSDGRDSMMSLVQLYHSAVKLGMDAPEKFEQAASLAVNDFARAIRSFPLRPLHTLDLAAWGMKEATTKDGFDYQLL